MPTAAHTHPLPTVAAVHPVVAGHGPLAKGRAPRVAPVEFARFAGSAANLCVG